MDRFYVIDDVFDERIRLKIRDFEYGPASPQKWYDLGTNPDHEKIFDIAIELGFGFIHGASIIGYEMWCNTRAVGWHYDHDEVASREAGKLITPIFAAVYYAEVANLEGGDLVTETHRITPVTNRLVIMSGGFRHAVYPYAGTRKAITLNPWDHKIINAGVV